MRKYLLIFDDWFGSRDEAARAIRRIEGIIDVSVAFEGSLFIESPNSADLLSKRIISAYPGQRFFLTEISENRQGWMPRNWWEFIRR